MSDTSFANRLIHERSPYLLQHASNPVDWYPWGKEAFEAARNAGKPIFLSVGYSTCHWCHVMAHESFIDQRVADMLNMHFISIKVDREERPDIDSIYMAATQAMTGSGGWPMSVFLTPDLKPFYAGTYFPPEPKFGRPSFLQLLGRIAELWQTQRPALEESARLLTDAIDTDSVNSDTTEAQAPVGDSLPRSAYFYFERTFDDVEGGFGGAPKFPRPVQFDFLFNYYAAFGEDHARDMSLLTLRKMAAGGMQDHLAGGFHRYSVDAFWRVSHFEKMLYDQAQLIESYLDAWQISHDPLFSDTARSTIEYVLADMTHPDGGFFSAEDADSEGVEGKFYVWTKEEVERILGDDAPAFCRYYGITPEGNFEHGLSVLHTTATIDEIVTDGNTSREEVLNMLSRSRKKLLQVRESRVRPLRDDKILTSWNGLMIAALSRASQVLSEPRYRDAAQKAAAFIWTNLRPEHSLLHRWRAGEARFAAYLDSYAFLIKGFLALYEATDEIEWLHRSIELQREQDAALYDSERGGYFLSRNSEDLLIRTKLEYDGAEPSGNSVAVLNLIRLSEYTEDAVYRSRAEECFNYFERRIATFPHAMPELLCALFWLRTPPTQIVVTGDQTEAFKEEISKHYLPTSITIRADRAFGPFAKGLLSEHSKAYVCRNFHCELPVGTVTELHTLLG